MSIKVSILQKAKAALSLNYHTHLYFRGYETLNVAVVEHLGLLATHLFFSWVVVTRPG